MEDDATKEGVSEETIVDPREELVISIIEKNDEERDQYEKEMEPKEQGDIIEDDENEEEPEEMVKVVVDGEEQEVPLSKILDAGKRTLQKETAADKRLEEATNLLKEAKTVQPSTTDAEEDEPPQSLTMQEIAHAIQYGTEDEAAEAIEQLSVAGNTKPSVTPEDVEMIAKKAVVETTSAKEIETRFFATEEEGGFFDLTEDPHLMNMAYQNVNKRLENGESNTWETYEKAGKDVREWVEQFKPAEKHSDFNDKKERKKKLDTVRGANDSKISEDKNPRPQSAADIVKEMAKGRPGGG